MSEESQAQPLLNEVRSFLADLERELPELYPKPAASGTREAARAWLTARTEYWGERMGLRHKRVFIKDQRTLWGSCSSQGNINYNWRLIFAPEPVRDYIVIHELAHLREMNHSKRFWALVAEFCPAWREHRKWLADNHRSLKRRKEASGGDAGLAQ